MRGNGKRQKSTAPGIEGIVLVPSASASIPHMGVMSEGDRQSLLNLVRYAQRIDEGDHKKLDGAVSDYMPEDFDHLSADEQFKIFQNLRNIESIKSIAQELVHKAGAEESYTRMLVSESFRRNGYRVKR